MCFSFSLPFVSKGQQQNPLTNFSYCVTGLEKRQYLNHPVYSHLGNNQRHIVRPRCRRTNPRLRQRNLPPLRLADDRPAVPVRAGIARNGYVVAHVTWEQITTPWPQ